MAMLTLRDIPIQRKLSLAIMITSFLVVLITTLTLVGTKIYSFKQELVENLSTLGRVVGLNSQASLSFEDNTAARETLSALQAESSIRFAQIITPEGDVFAEYNGSFDVGEKLPVAQSSKPGWLQTLTSGSQHHRFHYRYLDLWQPIVLDGEVIGIFYIRADLNDLYHRLWNYALIAGSVLLISFLIAYSLSAIFQKVISGPILHLVETAKEVSRSKNYTIRAEKIGNDELGVLIDRFNEMLSQIQIRDQALEEHKSNLEELIELRTAELSDTNRSLEIAIVEMEDSKKKAEQASQAKSEFLANMSHELRTPLNHIIGFTELVVSRNFGEINAIQAEYLNDALTSSHHLLSLINDILDISKIEAGKNELELSKVHILKVLKNSMIMIQEKSMKHRIDLTFTKNNIPDTIVADERKLKQVLYNLLSNAAKFTPAGGEINLIAEKVDPGDDYLPSGIMSRLQHSFSMANRNGGAPGELPSMIQITIIDTGIGLKSEDLERIFKPFDQVESSTSRRFQGTGLGLALSRQFVEMHGGVIWAESSGEGQGTMIRFLIPEQAQVGKSDKKQNTDRKAMVKSDG